MDTYNVDFVKKTGKFAQLFTAEIIVNKNIPKPIGYSKEELPDGLLITDIDEVNNEIK